MKKVNYTPRKHTRFRDLKSIKDVFKDLKKYHRVIDLCATAPTQKEGNK